jgi:dTDP-4-dehydrorhamnose reductase
MKKIMVLGSTGLLGSEIERVFGSEFRVFPFNSKTFDLEKRDQFKKIIVNIKPNILINTAAMTNVDLAEQEKEKALKINGFSAKELARLSNIYNFELIHISTDYVFDGEKGEKYKEADFRKAINFYGYTKIMAEEYVERISKKYKIFRVAWLIGEKRKTLFDFITNYKDTDLEIINDQWGDPTFSWYAAEIIKQSIEKSIPAGIYNLTSSANITRYQFAIYLKKVLKLPFGITPISSARLQRPATRPKNSSLSNQKLADALNITPLTWEEQLREFLKRKDEK